MTTSSGKPGWRLDRSAILALTITAMVCVTALVCTGIWTYGNRYEITSAEEYGYMLDKATGDVWFLNRTSDVKRIVRFQ